MNNDIDSAEHLMAMLLSEGIHTVPPVEEDPDITLRNWAVFEAEDKDGKVSRHFVGTDIRYRDGRASTDIVSFSHASRVGKTMSGRKYGIMGEPGIGRDAEHVWSRWKAINDIVKDKNVSNEYILND